LESREEGLVFALFRGNRSRKKRHETNGYEIVKGRGGEEVFRDPPGWNYYSTIVLIWIGGEGKIPRAGEG
jgi:hypothetical protein